MRNKLKLSNVFGIFQYIPEVSNQSYLDCKNIKNKICISKNFPISKIASISCENIFHQKLYGDKNKTIEK